MRKERAVGESKFHRMHPELEVTYLRPEKRVGLVLVLTGYGKGKTSSAIGMVVRACGHGMKVLMIQFMKGDIFSGEWDGLGKLECDVELIPAGMGFCGIQGNPFTRAVHREAARTALRTAREKISTGYYDLVVLDEVNNAINLKLLDLDDVLELVRSKPPFMHLVLTGRDAEPSIIDLADTVSEVRDVKHAFRKDVEPQPGIDY